MQITVKFENIYPGVSLQQFYENALHKILFHVTRKENSCDLALNLTALNFQRVLPFGELDKSALVSYRAYMQSRKIESMLL